MSANLDTLEQQLDDFDPQVRREALEQLVARVREGAITLPEPGTAVNLHCHTFFSFNSYGYSPSRYAWLARRQGLAYAGTVDFDVLDALEEFHAACTLVGLKGCVGLETRVFVPEFADREITSPGEPGITYHMGVGFPSAGLGGDDAVFLLSLKDTAVQRNRVLLERVNGALEAIALDYERDVLPLTPAGNATERHICLAYARKAVAVCGGDAAALAYWAEKLGVPADKLDGPESATLLNTIRSKLMKRGGIGYVQPDAGSFPGLRETNAFLRAAGAIPTHTWLNGLSAGEAAIEELLDISMATGSAALNIIPDRNYTPGQPDEKLAKLQEIVAICRRRHLPISVGTEMNSFGQKFVDSFDTAELRPLLPAFLSGARVIYAHSVLQRTCGLGYLSDWAGATFADVAAKNDFFERFGQACGATGLERFAACDGNATPPQLLALAAEA